MSINVVVDEGADCAWASEAGLTKAKLRLSFSFDGPDGAKECAYGSVLDARLRTPNYPCKWRFVEAGGRPILGFGPLTPSENKDSETSSGLNKWHYLLFSHEGEVDGGCFEEGDTLSFQRKRKK